jgi:hypothetical protein
VNRLKAFAAFCYDFVVGDDWRLAVGVLVGLVITVVLARAGLSAWWVLPVGVVVGLGASLASAVRGSATGS